MVRDFFSVYAIYGSPQRFIGSENSLTKYPHHFHSQLKTNTKYLIVILQIYGQMRPIIWLHNFRTLQLLKVMDFHIVISHKFASYIKYIFISLHHSAFEQTSLIYILLRTLQA